MSWSISRIGRAKAVAQAIADDIEKIKCAEPEQTIKAQVGAAIAMALTAFPEDYAVRVSASGSQSGCYPETEENKDRRINNLDLKIEPLYGFVG